MDLAFDLYYSEGNDIYAECIDDGLEKIRSRAYRRHKDYSKAIRKRNISDAIYRPLGDKHYFNNLHQYSKNKIHCSCSICACKSKSKNGMNVSISDTKRIGLKNYKRARESIKSLIKLEEDISD